MKSAWSDLPTRDGEGHVLAVIEAAGGSRCKFKYEPGLGVFVLHSMLPTGTSFPHAFGFIPATLGEDGDPLDVLVLTDESPPVATVVPCRLIAVLEANQSEKKQHFRNDRFLAVADTSERYASCVDMGDVDQKILERIADFFVFYHREQGKTFQPLGWKGASTADALLSEGCRARQR